MGDELVEPIFGVFGVTFPTPHTITCHLAVPGGVRVCAEQTFQPLLQPPTSFAGSLPGPKLVWFA
jgi:hypothetical protein